MTLASDLPLGVEHHYVGHSNHQAGRLAGELMGRLMGEEGGKVLLVAGLEEFSGHREREAGFGEVLAESYPKVGIAERVEGRDQGSLVASSVSRVFRRRTDISGVYNVAHGIEEIARFIAPRRKSQKFTFVNGSGVKGAAVNDQFGGTFIV